MTAAAVAHPRRGLVEPDDLDFQEILTVATPYLGVMKGAFTEWTPLQGRGDLFVEDLDPDNPWQLSNVQGRQWAIMSEQKDAGYTLAVPTRRRDE